MKKMNPKRLSGMIVFVVGIILLAFSIYAMARINSAKGTVNAISKPFSGNPIGGFVGGELKSKASQYDMMVRWGLSLGIIFIVVGGGLIYFCRAKKR